MSVALSQPHRNGSRNPLYGSPLGRFVLSRSPSADENHPRYRAGCRYAELIDVDLAARGLPRRENGILLGLGVGGLTQEQLIERREEAAKELADARAAIREVDGLTVRALDRLCHQDCEIPFNWEGRVFNGLYKLSIHFEFEKRGYHG